LDAHFLEVDTIKERGTYTLEHLPPGTKSLRSHVIYKIKRNPDGSVNKRKARWVVDGRQHEANRETTYAPVIAHDTIRFVLALVAKFNWPLYQWDIKNAFLYGTETGELYTDQAPGAIVGNPKKLKCRIWKSWYGTKTASEQWNEEIDFTFREFGLNRSKFDSGLYYKVDKATKKFLLVMLYVDDIMTTGNDEDMINALKKLISSKYEYDDRGEAYHLLGYVIKRDRDKGLLKISQEHYVENLLKQYNMENAHPVSLPGPVDASNQVEEWSKSHVEDGKGDLKIPYRELLGSLMYISLISRPDISRMVNWLAKFASSYSEMHWKLLKNVLRYLKGTKCLGIVYGNTGIVSNVDFEVFADASFASESNGKSITGYCVKYNGGPICWRSKPQGCVSRHTCEAESIAMCEAIGDAKVYLEIALEINVDIPSPISVYCDNEGAICIANATTGTRRSRQVFVSSHYVKEQVDTNTVILKKVSTNEQVADILTKLLPKVKLEYFRPMLLNDSSLGGVLRRVI
jgi:Reverse transcriptase (RNA-dependent DNA polymerase)